MTTIFAQNGSGENSCCFECRAKSLHKSHAQSHFYGTNMRFGLVGNNEKKNLGRKVFYF